MLDWHAFKNNFLCVIAAIARHDSQLFRRGRLRPINISMLKVFNIFAVVAIAAIFGVFWYLKSTREIDFTSKPEGHIEAIIPKTLEGGWTSEEVPIATTEEVARATEKILNSSQYISRRYTSKDGKSFNLFVNYWARGQEDPQRASAHVPDRCWVENGWTSHKDKARGDFEIDIEGVEVCPANYRELSIEAQNTTYRRYAAFWHFIDNEPFEYNSKDASIPRLDTYVMGMVSSAVHGAPEQYFVRMDSDVPLTEFFGDPGFKQLMLALQNLTLAKKTAEGAK